MTTGTASAAGSKVTQSFKLYQQLMKKGAASSAELAKVIGRPIHQTSVYIAELMRVYGAKIIYDTSTRKYILQNRVDVPKRGVAGLKWKSHRYVPVQHVNLSSRPGRKSGRPSARAS